MNFKTMRLKRQELSKEDAVKLAKTILENIKD